MGVTAIVGIIIQIRSSGNMALDIVFFLKDNGTIDLNKSLCIPNI